MIFGKKYRDPSWYAAWRDEAFDDLTAKQARVAEHFKLGQWPRYDYDLESARLTFSDADKPMVGCDIQAVGTVGRSDWLWAWANDSIPTKSTVDLAQVRAYGDEHGIHELSSPTAKSKNLQGLGWMFTAIAVRLLDADGAYRTPDGLFMVCRSIRLLS